MVAWERVHGRSVVYDRDVRGSGSGFSRMSIAIHE